MEIYIHKIEENRFKLLPEKEKSIAGPFKTNKEAVEWLKANLVPEKGEKTRITVEMYNDDLSFPGYLMEEEVDIPVKEVIQPKKEVDESEEDLNEAYLGDKDIIGWIDREITKNGIDTFSAQILNLISQGISDDIDFKKLGKAIIKHTKSKFGV